MLLEFNYRAAVDWLALGIAMYEMMVGHHPFHLPKMVSYRTEILTSHVAYPERLTPSAVSIMEGVSIFNTKTEAF